MNVRNGHEVQKASLSMDMASAIDGSGSAIASHCPIRRDCENEMTSAFTKALFSLLSNRRMLAAYSREGSAWMSKIGQSASYRRMELLRCWLINKAHLKVKNRTISKFSQRWHNGESNSSDLLPGPPLQRFPCRRFTAKNTVHPFARAAVGK